MYDLLLSPVYSQPLFTLYPTTLLSSKFPDKASALVKTDSTHAVFFNLREALLAPKPQPEPDLGCRPAARQAPGTKQRDPSQDPQRQQRVASRGAASVPGHSASVRGCLSHLGNGETGLDVRLDPHRKSCGVTPHWRGDRHCPCWNYGQVREETNEAEVSSPG